MGTDRVVVSAVLSTAENRKVLQRYYERARMLARDQAECVIAFGCKSGIHRSVVFANEIAARLMKDGCNGIDDDFDGVVDEDAMGMLELADVLTNSVPPLEPTLVRVGDTCGESDGTCSTGIVECRGAHLFCAGARLPHRNNANNFVDICGSGLDDDCRGGHTEAGCDDQMTVESCNGRDDDRDGRIDEGAAADNEDRAEPSRPRESSVVRQCIATPPLSEISGDCATGFDVPFDDVVLAAGSESAEGLRIGMAYREFTPGGGTRIAFRILTFHNECRCVGDGSCGSESCRPIVTPTALRSSGDAHTQRRRRPWAAHAGLCRDGVPQR